MRSAVSLSYEIAMSYDCLMDNSLELRSPENMLLLRLSDLLIHFLSPVWLYVIESRGDHSKQRCQDLFHSILGEYFSVPKTTEGHNLRCAPSLTQRFPPAGAA